MAYHGNTVSVHQEVPCHLKVCKMRQTGVGQGLMRESTMLGGGGVTVFVGQRAYKITLPIPHWRGRERPAFAPWGVPVPSCG